MPGLPTPAISRFWKFVKKGDGCWMWKGCLKPNGYGVIWEFGRTRYSHILSYEILKGEIPKGKQIDHLCRNRSCVNPNHLEAVCPRDNCLRGNGLASENSRKTHCPQNHPYSGKNLRIDKRGWRNCRACYEKEK